MTDSENLVRIAGSGLLVRSVGERFELFRMWDASVSTASWGAGVTLAADGHVVVEIDDREYTILRSHHFEFDPRLMLFVVLPGRFPAVATDPIAVFMAAHMSTVDELRTSARHAVEGAAQLVTRQSQAGWSTTPEPTRLRRHWFWLNGTSACARVVGFIGATTRRRSAADCGPCIRALAQREGQGLEPS
ncbi:hypothetical protein [Leifsonia aquatica]|uniref:hypothetical protein n=1 Tax=Leifsonia aquatica TaxID=144185 RepID=UPI0038279C2C